MTELVPEIGLEPIQYRYRWILSPLRLPVSPLGQYDYINRFSFTEQTVFSDDLKEAAGVQTVLFSIAFSYRVYPFFLFIFFSLFWLDQARKEAGRHAGRTLKRLRENLAIIENEKRQHPHPMVY